jgi:hypothetical protein
MADDNPNPLASIAGDPQAAGRLIQSLSSKNAQRLSGTLEAQLRTAQEGLGHWTENFTQQLNVAQASMNSFKTTSEAMFGGLGDGMTKSISNATTYSKSIGEAMDRTLKSTLTSITREALVRALYNTGLGFYFLAVQAYGQAAQAFEAAATFGSIAGAAGALAGAIPGGASASSSAKSSKNAKSSGSASSSSGASTPASAASGNLTVMVVGEAQAATWLTRVISTGVENYDLKLVASHTKRSAPAGR